MADIKQITLPSGQTYDLVDAGARELISALEAYSEFIGVTSTELTDGSTTNPVIINGESKTAKKGEIVTYGSAEFIWNGSAWQEFGDLSALGALAYKSSASGTYTPAGTVSAPDITVTPTTGTVLGSVATAGVVPTCTLPTATYANEVLTFTAGSFNGGSMPTFDNATVLTGASAALDNAPSFSGTEATISVS